MIFPSFSMDKAALEFPWVEILTLLASIFPLKEVLNPLDDFIPVEVISVSVIFTLPLLVDTKASESLTAVIIFPPVIVKFPPFTKTAELRPEISLFLVFEVFPDSLFKFESFITMPDWVI